MCDYRTVDDTDRVATDIIFPDYLGETYNFWPNPKHRLYFVDGQRPDEAWMIKCFDSETANDSSVAPCKSSSYFLALYIVTFSSRLETKNEDWP